MSTARRVASGAAWTYGAQFLSIVVQFVYAAITSRIVGADGFGAYAVALAVSGFAILIATGGLGQSVGRMVVLEAARLKALVTYALLLGLGSSVFLFASTPLWVQIWSAEGATSAIHLAVINAFTAPLFGLATGLVRRLGKFRQLAVATLTTNVVGMCVGAACVFVWPTAAALMVSAIVAQTLLLLVALGLSDRLLLGMRSVGAARSDITYSWQLTATSFASYLTHNLTKISVTRAIGVSALGQWNRAEVFTTVPFQQIQSAMIQAVYPEFRHVRHDRERANRIWTDLVVLVAWLVMPASAAVSVVAPVAIPLVFGPGWEDAAAISVALAFVGGLQVLSSLLGGAIESLGRFKWIWANTLLLLSLQIVAVVAILYLRWIWIAIGVLVLTGIVRHAVQIVFCLRAGYLDNKRLARGYLSATLATAVVWALGTAGVWVGENAFQYPIYWIPFVALLCLPLAAVWRMKESLPPMRIARLYKLL